MIRRGQKFGDWQVVDSKCVKVSNSGYMILCYDPIANDLKYVSKYNLLAGTSTKSRLRLNEWFGGCCHTTRYLHKELPKYIQYFPHPSSKKKFRVVRNTKDLGYKTYGYFKTLKEAKNYKRQYLGETNV
jgi:hypothetical protein